MNITLAIASGRVEISIPAAARAKTKPLATIWVSPAQAVIVSFVALILTLLVRPTGLFVPTPK